MMFDAWCDSLLVVFYSCFSLAMGVGSGVIVLMVFFFQAEDGIRDLVRSRGLGDVYKRQPCPVRAARLVSSVARATCTSSTSSPARRAHLVTCLLYTSDAADERSSVDLGGRRIINKKKKQQTCCDRKTCTSRSIQHSGAHIHTKKNKQKT